MKNRLTLALTILLVCASAASLVRCGSKTPSGERTVDTTVAGSKF
jgi:hypothetical protein